MSETYHDRKDSQIYGERLIIHKRKGNLNGFFYFRAKVDGHAGYIRRTCKTRNSEKAMAYAEQAFDDLRLKAKSGFALIELTVEKFYLDWLDRKKHNFTD